MGKIKMMALLTVLAVVLSSPALYAYSSSGKYCAMDKGGDCKTEGGKEDIDAGAV